MLASVDREAMTEQRLSGELQASSLRADALGEPVLVEACTTGEAQEKKG